MCKKASRIYFFKSHLCHMDRKTFSLKNQKKLAKKKKNILCTNLYSHKHGKKQSCQQIHLHPSSELLQLHLFGELTSFLPYSFPVCIYWDEMKLQRDFSYHRFLPCTLHFHTLFSPTLFSCAGLEFLSFGLFFLPCPLKLRQQHFVLYFHGYSTVIC